MKLHLQAAVGRHRLQSYDARGFVVNGNYHSGGTLLGLRDPIHPWGPERPEDLHVDHFQLLREDPPEILLLGTGSRQRLLLALLSQLRSQGLTVEMMDTPAACRTYTILVSEDRRVAAALLPAGW